MAASFRDNFLLNVVAHRYKGDRLNAVRECQLLRPNPIIETGFLESHVKLVRQKRSVKFKKIYFVIQFLLIKFVSDRLIGMTNQNFAGTKTLSSKNNYIR